MTIFEENEKDQTWSLYLSYMANPLTEGISFNDFREKFSEKTKSSVKRQKVQSVVNVQKQVYSAEQILKNFVPPEKKGGVNNGR